MCLQVNGLRDELYTIVESAYPQASGCRAAGALAKHRVRGAWVENARKDKKTKKTQTQTRHRTSKSSWNSRITSAGVTPKGGPPAMALGVPARRSKQICHWRSTHDGNYRNCTRKKKHEGRGQVETNVNNIGEQREKERLSAPFLIPLWAA